MLIDISVHLKPIYHREPPLVILKVDDIIIHSGELLHDDVFKYNGDILGKYHSISLELLNKEDSDCVDGKDKAVIVDKVTFFDIYSDNILYNSTYVPKYSDAYTQESNDKGIELDDTLASCNYLGWNGVWRIHFESPIFTWLHKIENLGWIYPS